MNPIFVAYAKAHGKSPEEMLEHDKQKWLGGRMTGFILWVQKMKQKFFSIHPEYFIGDHIANSHIEKWTAFLQEEASK